MRPGYKRSLRVAGLLKRELSRIILEELKDPSVGELSITQVSVSDDLRVAKVYIASLDDEVAREKTLLALRRATGYIRGQLGASTSLKFTPELRFFYDITTDQADRIEALLKQLRSNE